MTYIRFGNQGLSETGSMAFVAGFSDGREALFTAIPVPEPSSERSMRSGRSTVMDRRRYHAVCCVGLEELAPDVSSPRSIWTLIGVETTCLLGSEISRFGVSVWIYQAVHSVSAFSALLLANTVPGMLVSPLAGSIVDRSSRKRVMIGAATVSLCGTLILLLGATAGELSMPLVLAGAVLASIGDAFQWPALSATIPLMTTDADLPRYNGFLESGRAASLFAGPPIGGLLLAIVGLPGLISIELCTFVIATIVVASMVIPRPAAAPEAEQVSLLADSASGIKWILAHRPLFKFLLVATFANFFISIGLVVMAPYGLSFLSEREYGIANGLFGAGMIAGGLVYGVLSKRFTNAGQFLGYLHKTIGIVAATMMTIGNAAIMTVWQVRVPDELQGRVLSTMRLVADITAPVAYLLAGPISDNLVPALYSNTPTAQMGALFSVMGVILFVGFLLAWMVRDVRRVEDVAV